MNESTCETDEYGAKCWFFNGKLHRTDGPAIEYTNGTKAWFFNGKLHRIDGPAIDNVNGHKQWFLNGNEVTKEEFNEQQC